MIRLDHLPPIGQQPPPLPSFKHGPTELAMLASDWKGQPIGPEHVVETKHDGLRLLWIGGELVTREGVPFDAAEHLRPTFERLERRVGCRMFFDSEFVVDGGFLPTLTAFKRAAPNRGRAMLFDCVPLAVWRGGTIAGNLSLASRRRQLETIFDDWRPDDVRLVEQWRGVSPVAKAEEIWAAGGEGIVLKDRHSPYVRGRSPAWLKLKRKLTLACEVVEILNAGAAAIVKHEGRKLRVAIAPPLRGRVLDGQRVVVEAMEWTQAGALRQGIVVGIEGKNRQ